MIMFKKIIAALIASLTLTTSAYAQPMLITCYTPESCPGTVTASGQKVRVGIAAVTREHFGDLALIYTRDGEFLGYFECLDIIGTGKSTVIDIWQPTNEKAVEIMTKTKGKVNVEFIKGEG